MSDPTNLPSAAASVLRMTTWRARAVAGALMLALVGVCGVVWSVPGPEPAAVAGPAGAAASTDPGAGSPAELEAADSLAERRRQEAQAAQEWEARQRQEQEQAAGQADDAARAKAAAEARAAAGRTGTSAGGTTDAAAGRATTAASATAEARRDRESAADNAAQRANVKAQTKVIRGPAAPKPPAPAPPAKAPVTPTKAAIVAAAAAGERWFGFYTQQSPFDWTAFDAAERQAGRGAALGGYFQGWDGAFRADAVEASWRRGRLPLLTWQARPLQTDNGDATAPDYTAAAILAGTHDAYLHTYARAVAALGLPLGIRLNPEMNGTWYPWSDGVNTNQPGDYVRVWRHVHDIFAQEGANRFVIWIWAPGVVTKLAEHRATIGFLRSQYPGDAYVDWLGVSGYYRPPFALDDEPTFDSTFGRTLAQVRRLSARPILLAEVGASEVGGEKPAWVRSFFAGLAEPANADVIGFVWFNLAVTAGTGDQEVTNDWRIDSRADSLAAFRTGLAGARFGPVPRR